MHPLSRLALATAFVPIALGLGARAARGDDEEAAFNAKTALYAFSSAVHEATTAGMFGGNHFYQPPSACTKVVADGAAAGLKPSDTFTDGAGNSALWKRADKVCEDYARLHRMRAVIDAIQSPLSTIQAYLGPDKKPDKSISGEVYRGTVVIAQECVATIDKAIKDGNAADVPFKPFDHDGDTPITLTEARKICSDYAEFAKGAATSVDNQRADEVAAIQAKWSKLGITGDRLKYLVENGHHIMLGKGCSELDDRGKKTSSVFYEVYSDDAGWTVYKTQWKKDKKGKSSQRRFGIAGGYSCK